jgi:site-specific DNA-methyltransferase (adenine-specific)
MGMIQEDMKNKEKRVHPTQKPVALAAWTFNEFKAGNNILDLFLGSGSTMVAAHQLKRKCYGMELDPKYCQVIVDRMKKLDPALEVKINGEPYGQN